MSVLSKIEGSFSPELMQEIGLLFITAGAAEHALAVQMTRLIAHPNAIDPATVIALAGTETKVRLQQIQTLITYRLQSDMSAALLKQCDTIRDAFQNRNHLAHWLCSEGTDPHKVVLKNMKANKAGNLSPDKPLHRQQIREWSEKIHTSVRTLDVLLNQAGITKLPIPVKQDP